MKQRVLTLHVKDTRLTAEVVEMLSAISEHLGRPDMVMRSDGLAFYVDSWSGRI